MQEKRIRHCLKQFSTPLQGKLGSGIAAANFDEIMVKWND